MKLCKDCVGCKMPIDIEAKQLEGSASDKVFAFFSTAECLNSPYTDFVSGRVFYFYCRNVNRDGECKMFEGKAGTIVRGKFFQSGDGGLKEVRLNEKTEE